MDNAHKATLTVATAVGVDLGTDFQYTIAPAGVISAHVEDGHLVVVGEAAGTATITATNGGSSGSLDVVVTDAPLVLTLGTPVPR